MIKTIANDCLVSLLRFSLEHTRFLRLKPNLEDSIGSALGHLIYLSNTLKLDANNISNKSSETLKKLKEEASNV